MLKRLVIIFSTTAVLFLLFLLISTSFENIYIHKDEYIILKTAEGTSQYIVRNNKEEETGILEIIEGKITFIANKENVATAIYNHKTKILTVTGTLNKTDYEQTEFKQVTNMTEYLKTIF